MRLASILILSILIFFQSSSQNYKTIIPEVISHYGEDLFPISIDSLTFSSDSIFYHSFKMLRYQDNGYFSVNGDSWTGKNIIIMPNGYNMYINKDNDTIKVNTLAEINESWHLYDYNNGNYIEAKISSKSSEMFIEITDSIKTISLQMKDSNGNNLNSDLNNLCLKLSKNHGFIRIFNFYEFPYNNVDSLIYPFSPEMDIKSFDDFGHQNFGASEIFGYEVTDEKHINYYYFEFDCNDPICELEEKDILIVTNKYISNNQDTIIYTFDKCGQKIYEGGVYTENWHYITTESIILSDPSNERLNNLNFQPYYNEAENEYIITASNDTAKWIKLILTGTDENHLNIEFQNPENIDDFSKIYYKGLGGDFFWFFTLCCIEVNQVVYSKNGENEWGNPYNCDDFSEIEFHNDELINIYPNPTSNRIRLEYGDIKVKKIMIYDITGKVIIETTSKEDYFDLSDFPAGTYIMNIQSEKTTKNIKIIKE